jgi:hypothetical protein
VVGFEKKEIKKRDDEIISHERVTPKRQNVNR